jgi:thioesterase domain-containing protein/acyl carrier protein
MSSVEHSPASPMIEALTLIWRRVLQRSSVHAEDDFFELGGDSAAADKLFAEITKEFGKEFPAVMVYRARTIAAQASMLRQPGPSRFPPTVVLNTGRGGTPIFLAHGIGSSVLEFFQLVRHLKLPNAIYGIQAKSTDGVEAPLDCIEDMAEFHIAAIKETQPNGPYFLIGYSLGGLVMLEVAQRLSKRGEKIGLLAMLDAYPHRNFLSLKQRVRLVSRLAGQRVASLLRVSSACQTVNADIGGRTKTSVSRTSAMLRMREGGVQALRRYRPDFYNGEISFVRAASISEFPDDAAAVWSDLARKFTIETVPGDHQGILRTHFESLAAVLSRMVTKAMENKVNSKSDDGT